MKSNVSILKRLGAIIYDSFLVFSLIFFTGLIIVITIQQETKNILFFFTMLVSFFGYFIISWVRGGQTIGMKAWGFKIVQLDGSNITYKQSIIRLALALPSLFLFFFVFLNKEKLALHNYYSKTYLIKVIK